MMHTETNVTPTLHGPRAVQSALDSGIRLKSAQGDHRSLSPAGQCGGSYGS